MMNPRKISSVAGCCLLLLCGLLVLGPWPDPAHSEEPQGGGNRKLMQQLIKEKRALRDAIVNELKAKGKIPKDGTVEFRAKVKPNPDQPHTFIFTVENLKVYDGHTGQQVDTGQGQELAGATGLMHTPGSEEVAPYVTGKLDFDQGIPQELIFMEGTLPVVVAPQPESAGAPLTGGGSAVEPESKAEGAEQPPVATESVDPKRPTVEPGTGVELKAVAVPCAPKPDPGAKKKE